MFQVLPHTLGLGAQIWRVLARGHEQRNLTEYGGAFDLDERIVKGVFDACEKVLAAIER